MKKILLTMLCFAIAATAFAYDGGDVTEAGRFEASTGFAYVKTTGYYDEDSKKQDVPGNLDPAATLIPLGLSYGIIDGLEAGLDLAFNFLNKDAGDVSGLDRPVLSAKYIDPALNFGGFVEFALPLGSEDIVGKDPEAAINLGVAYEARFNAFEIDTALEYNLTFEGDDKTKQDGFTLYVNPEYYLMDELSLALDIMFVKTFDEKFDGDSVDDTAGHLLALAPGVDYDVTDDFVLSASVPFTVMGKNSGAFVGFGIEAKYKF
ncbi:MAG: transporter [Spirochaetia bacterium]|jgi:hypothetical protein|nr:transporter [Spirochaetia bacterium]